MDHKRYKDILTEPTSVDGMVLPGERIVIAMSLRDKTVEIAHEGHQGIVPDETDFESTSASLV